MHAKPPPPPALLALQLAVFVSALGRIAVVGLIGYRIFPMPDIVHMWIKWRAEVFVAATLGTMQRVSGLKCSSTLACGHSVA